MPNIPYRASNFATTWGAALSGSHTLSVSWGELVWAAVTMGKPGTAFLLSHGWHSVSDTIVRTHNVYANLRASARRYEKSTLYENLDPTEKGATSYFIGMMAAKLVGARLLDTPWLFHLSMFSSLGGTASLVGNSSPDLIGTNTSGDWVVVEAKGRTNGYDSVAMTTAKTQTRQVRRINGTNPVLRVATQAYFSPALRFAIDDPEEYDEKAIDISVARESAFHRYYSFALESTDSPTETRTVFGRQFDFKLIEQIGVSIGVDRKARKFMSAENTSANQFEGLFGLERGRDESQSVEVFSDGLAIALDDRWSEKNMKREPNSRSST